MDLRILHTLKKINCETCKLTVISFGRAAKLCKDIGEGFCIYKEDCTGEKYLQWVLKTICMINRILIRMRSCMYIGKSMMPFSFYKGSLTAKLGVFPVRMLRNLSRYSLKSNIGGM